MEESGRKRIGAQRAKEQEAVWNKKRRERGRSSQDTGQIKTETFWNTLEEKAVQKTCERRSEQRKYEQRQRERRLREEQESAARRERQTACKRQRQKQLQKALVEKEWEKRFFMRMYLQQCYVEKMLLARLKYEGWLRSGSLERKWEELERMESNIRR